MSFPLPRYVLSSVLLILVFLGSPGIARAQAVVVDDADRGNVEITAYWKRLEASEVKGAHGPSVLSDDGLGADSVVRLMPDLPADGDYDVWLYWPALSDTTRRLAKAASITVRHAGSSMHLTLNMRDQPQTWHRLGTFHFNTTAPAYVEIRTDNANGVVLADAARFAPADSCREATTKANE